MKNILQLFSIISIFSYLQVHGQAVVNLGKNNQVIDGFGASSAWCGAIGDNVMNALYGDLGYSILRLRIEEGIKDNWKTGNFSSWAPELSNAKKASAKGAVVFASPWNPPPSMQENFTKSGDASAQRLRYDKYAEYVDYLNAYVKYMKDNGVNLHAISVQNEPDYATDWNWWTPTEMLNFMKNNAGNINCKVIVPESFQYLKNMSDPILNDATAFANMDILGFHLYGTPVNQLAYSLFQQKKGTDKKAWMTEHYFDTDGIADIMAMSKELHDCMVTGNMNAYVYWWITWPNGLANSNGTIFKRAYVLGQFAKFIRPGYYRVEATATPATNVYVSAYTGSGKAVIVAVNTGTSAVNQSFSIQNGTLKSVSPYTTDNTRNMQAGTNIAVSNNSFSVQLPAQSITTFVGDLGNVPQVVFTSPTTAGAYTIGTPINLAATATIASGSIASVKFYDGATLLNTDNSSPYSYSWTAATAGKHLLKVVATDNLGNTASDTLTIKVNVPQGPYNGIVHPIPGIIQAEEYDLGGNGIAYNDATTGNTGGATFRTDEDVDLETCTDAGGGYNLGYATAGEWLEYTVNVTTTGTYDLNFRVACNGDGRTVSVSMDGTTIANNVAIPNTAAWQTWQTVMVKNVPLTAGQKVMRLTIGAVDYVNINYLTFNSVITDISDDLSTLNINIYPNPFEDQLFVETEGEFHYQFMNTLGVVLEEGTVADKVVLDNKLSKGVYLLKVKKGDLSRLVKLVKE